MNSNSIKGIFKRRLTKLISKFYDPLVYIKIGNQKIKIPFSHALRENVIGHPELNFNLARIVSYAASKTKDVKVIDIGANVGDTVAYIRNFSDAPILCIDGEEKYLDILRKNIEQYKDISVCHSIVGNETSEKNIQLKSERGTAFIVEGNSKTQVKTLEDILNEYPDFKNSKILKLDTDGYDTFILKGSKNYLKNNTPILFFEFDPYLMKANDDPFTLTTFLKECGYRYLMFYMSNGDFLLSCDILQEQIITELVHYFSGRNILLYADICAYSEKDKEIFDFSVVEEIKHYEKARAY